MSKRRRLVVFDKEVAEPGEPVAHGQPQQSEPGMMERERGDTDQHTQRGAAGVKRPIARVTVLSQVKKKEFVVRSGLS